MPHCIPTVYPSNYLGSFAALGAMSMCIPTGFVCDLIGRKKTLLLLVVPFMGGWALIIFAKDMLALYFGRFVTRCLYFGYKSTFCNFRLITGMAVGACCVAAPLYTGEIAHQSIRGALGTLFQLMIITGILISYLLGVFLTPYKVSMIFHFFCFSKY